MKIQKSLFGVILLLMCIFLSTSCSKDKEEDDTNVLYGTKWQTRDYGSFYELMYGSSGGPIYTVIDFNQKTTCEVYYTQNGIIVMSMDSQSYTVSGNTVTFKNLEDGKITEYTFDDRNMKKKEGSSSIVGFCSSFIKQ